MSLALCNPCLEGSFSSEGLIECTACEINSYAAAASSICECNAGFTRQAGLPRCTACAKGKFKGSPGDTQCLLCPAGTYSIDIGAISEQMCRECSKDSSSPVGSSSLSACERTQEQCGFSNTNSGAQIEFQANLPYIASTFTTAVQDNFKIGVAAACRADGACQVSKSQVEIASIVESGLPRRRLHATSISVGLIIFVESEAHSNKLIGGLTKDNLNRELQIVGVEPMSFVSAPTTVVRPSAASGGETAFLDSGVVVALIVAAVATVAAASFLYCCYVRMGSRVDPHAQCIRVAIKAKTGDKVMQSVLPVEIRSNFEADCVLGSGTNSKVIKVWNLVGGRRTHAMAIKFLYPLDNDVFTEQQVQLLKQEAAAIKHVKSHFVVTYTTYAQTETEFAIVMECLDGYSLDKLIEDRTREGIPPMNETEAMACINDVLQGLQAIHEQNLVHRNIKPGSIFLVETQTLKRHVVTDLGSAAITMTSELEASNTNTLRSQVETEVGTLGYMPPEAAHFLIGSIPTDRVNMQSDLYSAGASLFHLVSGRVPFQGSTPAAIRFNIVHEETPSLTQTSRDTGIFSCSPFFSKFVEMAMHKDMEKRFATAQDMLKIVQNPTVTHTFVEDYVCDDSQVAE